jgi:hypothetical protein
VFYAYVKDRGTNDVELYHLQTDIGETKNVARENPAVVERLLALARSFRWPEKLPYAGIALPAAPGAAKKIKGKS